VKEKLEALVSEMIDRGLRYEEAVSEFERKFIMTALDKNKGNQTKAAKVLGIHRNTLNKRVTSYNHHKRSKR
jgi:Fis family transcriptional regulator, factor for inversion stimulation protein